MAHDLDPHNSNSSFMWDWDSFLLLANPSDTPDADADADADAAPAHSHEKQRRRRDPRLSCPNFLAGRVPCACSDEEDEEEADRSRKRSKVAASASARCQVSACHADLAGLKGYHQRHRVCLTCANAAAVVLRGQNHRYCQQCGKFHPLGDFDEDKRSCRRKLERHNDRRRRKQPEPDPESAGDTSVVASATPAPNSNNSDASEVQQSPAVDKTASDLYCFQSHQQRMQASSKPQRHHAGGDEDYDPHTSASAEESLLAMLLDEQQDQHKQPVSRHTTYTSPCPTRRISFKFYDWNPADFPRRLREQIMEWLANMPVELEGYIRSGCTILTLFIAMPPSLWAKLDEDWSGYLAKLVTHTETGFWDKGFVAAFLDNQVAYIHNGSVSSPSHCERARKKYPIIESVSPPCVEMGTRATLTVTGHNLFRLNSRVLFGSRGKYLPCFVRSSDNCCTSIQVDVVFPQDAGIAFVEIGYDHGISNAIPLLVADKQLCEDVLTLGEAPNCCYFGQDANMLADLGWVISDSFRAQRSSSTTLMHICRLEQLLAFAVHRGWSAATTRVLQAAHKAGQAHRVDLQNALQLAVMHKRADIINALLLFQNECFSKVVPDASPPPPQRSYLLQFTRLRYKRKTIVKVAVGFAMACAGICLVAQHPRQVFQVSTSLRRCLWYTP